MISLLFVFMLFWFHIRKFRWMTLNVNRFCSSCFQVNLFTLEHVLYGVCTWYEWCWTEFHFLEFLFTFIYFYCLFVFDWCLFSFYFIILLYVYQFVILSLSFVDLYDVLVTCARWFFFSRRFVLSLVFSCFFLYVLFNTFIFMMILINIFIFSCLFMDILMIL